MAVCRAIGWAATISAAEKELGDRRNNQDGGLDPNLGQSVVEGGQLDAVDDLGLLHNLA